jgi:hypothetical protein
MSKQIGICILFSMLLIRSAVADVSDCAPLLLSQDVAVPSSVGTLGRFKLTNHKAFTEATLEFTKSGSAKVEAVFALVELFAGTDRLIAIPLNAEEKSRLRLELPIALSPLQQYKIALAGDPGTGISLYGYNPRVMNICPTKAVLTYFKIWYSNRTGFEHSVANWYSDAVPLTIPNAPEQFLRGRSLSVLISIRVDASGHVQIMDMANLDHEQSSALQKHLESWLFLPALDGGRRISTTARISLLTNSCVQGPQSPEREKTWIPVVICPRHDPPLYQEVYVGGFLQ